MSQTVIKVENLSKQYQLGTIGYGTIRHDLQAWWSKIRGKEDPNAKLGVKKHKDLNETFMALQDVSFEIKEGEAVGIIGKNGAGKSTLLKILSRTTAPTSGQIKIKGKIASLLEVGTGFHPELTGRENVFLNGAILGMKKKEIAKKFDEIVAFSGIEQFIDTPVKRYSSGMYVRLAFAVAANLDSDILILDEVLAVGDAEFQKKCLGKMDDVAKNQGRTVIFVSHNMAAVESLCTKGLVLEKGRLVLDDDKNSAVNFYIEKSLYDTQGISINERTDREFSGKLKFIDLKITNDSEEETNVLKSGQNYTFKLFYKKFAKEQLNNVIISFAISDEKGAYVLLFRTDFYNISFDIDKEYGIINCKIFDLPLADGIYHVTIFMSYANIETLDFLENAKKITVDGGDFFQSGSIGLPSQCRILTRAKWYV
ncbi:MAG TPA: ABC transporter ATP-binding protein [Spirochaetota bacterium]|nr:ABC transporter ATP-binding protein [Spirochaetota bacterium]